MDELVLAPIAFVGTHFVLANAPVRALIVARFGEGPFLVVFSMIAAATLAWMIVAYGAAPYVALWTAPTWVNLVPLAVMPFAFVFLVVGYATPNPTAVRQAKVAASANPARGILTITRHPLMWGMALWAASHVPPNGDVATMIFLGAVFVLAVGGMALLDLKKRRQLGADWPRFAAVTSALPFVAALQGRTKLDWAGIGWWRIALALVAFAFFLAIHPWLIGVPAVNV